MTIGMLLRVLFSLMLACVVGTLLLPINDDLQQRAESAQVVRNAQAARSVFMALQNLRADRGPTRRMLESRGAASAEFIAQAAASRAASGPAIAATLEQCAAIDCAGANAEIFSGLPAILSRLEAVRREADTALLATLDERRPTLAKDFNAAATDVIDRLEHMSKVLGEKVRMADAETAELIQIKDLGWVTRDGIGLERGVIDDAIQHKSFAPAAQARGLELRVRAELAWSMIRELAARPGVPADVVAAVRTAHEQTFEIYERMRRPVREALLRGEAPGVTTEEYMGRSAVVVEALLNVPNTAMAAAERQGRAKGDEATRSLMIHGGLLLVALLLGAAGFVVVQRRVTRPIGAMTQTMKRLADGDVTVGIPATARRDAVG